MKKLFLILVFLFLALPAWATDRYVATTGSDSNSGLIGSPFLTSQKCADTVTAGETCYFRSGTYGGFTATHSGTAGNPITFKNYPGEAPVLSAASGTTAGTVYPADMINLSMRNYVTVDGLKVRGVTGVGSAHVVIEAYGSSFINILNCEASLGYSTGIGIYQDAHDVLVQNCRIFDNSYSNWPRGARIPFGDWGAGMIAFHNTYNVTFRNNLIYWNHGEGVTCGDHSHEVVFDGNVVADNWSVNLYASDGCQNVTVKNNVVFTTQAAIDGEGSEVDGCSNPYNNACNPDGIVLTSGDSSSAYTFDERNITGMRIYNNLVIHSARGIVRYNHESGHPDSDWVIANNTFVKTDVNTSFTGAASMSNFKIQNNIFTEDRHTGFANGALLALTPAPTASTISNNLYSTTSAKWTWGSTDYTTYSSWAAASGDSASSTANPLLTNTSISLPVLRDGDDAVAAATFIAALALTTGSPAIDAGVDLTATLTADISGNSRPAGSAFDIGADEFNGTSTTPPPSTIQTDSACTGQNSGSSITFSCTVANLPNRLSVLFVSAGTVSGTTISSLNFNGDSFGSEQCGADVIAGGTELLFKGYILIAPDTGTHTVTVNLSDTPAGGASAAMLTFNRVNQTTGYRSAQSNSGAGTSTSLVVASAPGDLVVDGAYRWDLDSSFIPGSGQTALYAALQVGSADPDYMRSSTKLATGTATAMYWTFTGGYRWGVCAMSLAPLPTLQPNFKNIFVSPVLR